MSRFLLVFGGGALLWAAVAAAGDAGAPASDGGGGGTDRSGEMATSGPVGPPGEGRATLTWTAPVQREGGECLRDLSGFVVMWGPMRSRMDRETEITLEEANCRTSGERTECGAERVCEYTVRELGPIKWYFAVKAVDGEGRMSAPSQTVFADLD